MDGVEENYDVELVLPENFYCAVAGNVYFFATCAVLLHLVGLRLDHPQDFFKLCVVALVLAPFLGWPDLVVSLNCDACVAFRDLRTGDVSYCDNKFL